MYHSHVLEHFSKEDGVKLMQECFRVLKPGGIIRIVVPDLERIARGYLDCLSVCLENPGDKKAQRNYEWMLLEMYDQTVRNSSGGEMLKYLSREHIENEDFVFQRIGEEGQAIRRQILNNRLHDVSRGVLDKRKHPMLRQYLGKFKGLVKRVISRDTSYNKFEQIGRFRLGGEIHQWMYDRHSLRCLLNGIDFEKICIFDAFTSYLPEWDKYNLDGFESKTRKPDSLFVEAVKPE